MQISHHQSNQNGIRKELVMMAKGGRRARVEVRSHEKEQVIVPRMLNPTGQKRRQLIGAPCVVKI